MLSPLVEMLYTYSYDPDTGNLEMKGSLSLDYEQDSAPYYIDHVYHLDFGTLSTIGQRNAVFNWLGHMESVEKIHDAYLAQTREKDESGNIIFGVDSAYSGLSFRDRLSKAMPAYKFNDELLSISAFAVTHPVSPYWTWGNLTPGPTDYVYQYYDFYILDHYK